MSVRPPHTGGKARASVSPSRALLTLLAVLVALLAVAPAAGATQFQRPFLEEFGSVEQPGFVSPLSIAVNQETGDVLVGDDGGNEEQEVAISATAGSFKLSLEGKTTEDLAFNADFETVKAALETSLGIPVSGLALSGAYKISFPAKQAFEQLTCEDGEPPLSGGSGCSVTTLQEGKAVGLFGYHADGTPAVFGALGSNKIDGKAGPGGKPCVEEPASCDKTPQNEVSFGQSGNIGARAVAVDPTNGNIYVIQGPPLNLVDIFSSEGEYLGQLTAAGSTKLNGVCGVAIDSTGSVYVNSSLPNRIVKFVPSGNPPVNADFTANFAMPGALMCRMAVGIGPSAGWLFVSHSNNGEVQGPLTIKMNMETGEFSKYANGYNRLVTVDPTRGNPLIEVEGTGNELAELDGSLESTNVVLSKLVAEGSEKISDFATDSSGKVYVVPQGGSHVLVYGSTPSVVPTVTVAPATEVTSGSARLSGTVNPENIDVEECFFEWGEFSFDHKTPCEESIPTDSSDHEVHATITGLKPNGIEYKFRLAAKNENGTERSSVGRLTSASTVQTEAATVTGVGSATLNGALRPEGSQYTDCTFEWGLTSTFGYEHTTPCTPEAAEIPADTGVHAVSTLLTGLQEATIYRFRVQATNGEGTLIGFEKTFETWGPPQIAALRAGNASQSAATIEAAIDPGGFETSYQFEWGPTTSYGHVAPLDPESIGHGEEPVRVQADLSGLSAATTYHYRVVAESTHDATASDDQIFETLNSCGLPERRCYELVSRRDVGPVAMPGEQGPNDFHYQAATTGAGLAYPVESGYSDSTKGHVVLYRGTRGADGWSSTQLSTPIAGSPQSPSIGSISGRTRWLSDDLSCGLGESVFALTDDPGPQLISEAGGFSLYRLDAGGGYTAVPPFAPESLTVSPRYGETGAYRVAGATQDCRKVIFSTGFRYHGIPASGLYEWEEGTLRSVGIVPGSGGEEVQVVADADHYYNGVSDDGSRVFFTAARQTSSNPEEIGEPGIFVRENGTATRDLSLSQTSTPSAGAMYRYATPDGSKVFFTANAGLTAESSPAGTDLYEYDLETDALTDLSVLDAPGGAQVDGFVGASDDGSHVYFIARGQFLPGYGRSFAENVSRHRYSLYLVHNGEVSFVASIPLQGGNEFDSLSEPGSASWSSRVSPDGRYLLFQAGGDVTGYDSGGNNQAYLYDAQGGSEGTICISCRPDGQPPFKANGTIYPVLAERSENPLNPSQFLTEGEDGPQVFFSSLDVLAPGAVEGQSNIYEWSHGQIFRLASSPKGQQTDPISGKFTSFKGASADGSDVYVATPETLNWEDGDERPSVYDARVGGGFPEPPPPPSPCDAGSEGACRGPSQGAPATSGPASATFSGPGNEQPGKAKKKHKKHKKSKHKKHKKSKHKKHKKSGTHNRAGANRRAGK